jgi:RNA polymerase sigma-70 factor (ECF subfamily)
VTEAEAAIDALYREHGHVVLRRARALLRSESEARDAVQDIFLGLLRHPEQLTGIGRVTAWLYRVTTHHCLNALRRRRGRGRLLGALRASSESPARSEQLAQVRSLLARLPDPLAEVTVYHHLDGMTYDEIAAMLGCSRRQVGYMLERVRTIATSDEPQRGTAPLWPKEQES